MDKRKQQREEFLNHMLSEVHKIPVAEVVGSVVDLVPSGRYLKGLCPFHADHHLGSFIVTPDKNLWRCFAEGIGGSPVTFVMEYNHIGYLQAAFKLAYEYGIISDEEYRKYSGKKWDKETVKEIRKTFEEPEKAQGIRADDDVIYAVYNAMPHVCPLSEAHLKHLRKERMLPQSALDDYFTVPTRHMNVAGKVILYIAEQISERKFGRKLKALNEDEKEYIEKIMARVIEQIRYVPGFFYNKNTQKIDFASYKGIGFLIRDHKGHAVGIQIRRDVVKEGESRYVFFSSAFAQSLPYAEGGASSGNPGGFIASKKDGKARLCITEGRFKAEKIAAEGNNAVYVSGVSSWKSVMKMVTEVTHPGECVYLMFDADAFGNTAVYKQLSALNNELEQNGLKTRLIFWAKENGKGFDDLVINKGSRYASYLKMMSFQEFSTSYNEVFSEVMKKFQIQEIRDLPGDRREEFSKTLQREMEVKLKLK